MTAAALSYEWTRMRTLRSTWILAGTAVAATAVVAWGYAETVRGMLGLGIEVGPLESLMLVVGGSSLAPVMAGTIGVLAVGGEYRHRTLRTTLLVTPNRAAALGAKALVVTALAIAFAVAGLASAWAVALAVLTGSSEPAAPAAEFAQFHVGQIMLVVGWGLLGLAIAVIVRSQLLALGAILLLPYAVEPTLRTVGQLAGHGWLETAAAYLPFAAGSAMADVSAGGAGTLLSPASSRADPLLGGLVFFAVIAVLGTAAVMNFRRQDV